jgi:mRNA interferase MazF
VPIDPSPQNGLRERSQIMIDKAHTLPRQKIGYVFGQIAEHDQFVVNRTLAVFLGFALS